MSGKGKVIELRGTVGLAQVAINGVRAQIFLPYSEFEQPKVKLVPAHRAEYDSLSESSTATFEGDRFMRPNGTGREEVICKEMWMVDASSNEISHDIEDFEINYDPVGLWYSRAHQVGQQAASSHIVFRLTPNRYLNKASINTQRFDGSCTVRDVRKLSFELITGVSLTFDRHYVWTSDRESSTSTRYGFQVAILDLPGDYHEPCTVRDQILPQLDDFLTLASFASAQRCVCIRWEVSDDSERLSYYDRGRFGRPSRRTSSSDDTSLIPLGGFEDFLNTAWGVFQDSPYKQAILSAVYALLPFNAKTIEAEFLSLFSALEEVLLVYRRENEKEFILSKDQWAELVKGIDKVISEKIPEKEIRKQLKEKLIEINRVSIGSVLGAFVTELGVNLVDLWPFVSENKEGLINIRNKLAHGSMEHSDSIQSLIVATEHLKWTLERIVLKLLQWPLEHTMVTPEYLMRYASAMIGLEGARKEMSDQFAVRI